MKSTSFSLLILGALALPFTANAGGVMEIYKCNTTMDLQTGQDLATVADTETFVEVKSTDNHEYTATAYTVIAGSRIDIGSMVNDGPMMLGTEGYHPVTESDRYIEFARTGILGTLTTATLSINGWYENVVSYACVFESSQAI